MDTLWQDLRFGWRTLTRSRGLAVLALVMLAVGIGANTAIFSVVHAVLLRPVPLHDLDRIVVIAGYNAERGITGRGLSYPSFLALQAQTRTFEALSMFTNERFTLTGPGDAEEVPAARVSASFFDVLGVRPTFGRSFVPDEDRSGGRNVLILSRALWHRRFAADPAIVGRPVMLSGVTYDVVGVFAHDMPVPYDAIDVWTTKAFEPSMFTPQQVQMGAGYLFVVGRITAGVTRAAAQAEVESVGRRYVQEHPSFTDADPRGSLRLASILEPVIAPVRPVLWALSAGVALVLLIACANLANLLLVRAVARSGEAAVRVALGASRMRMVRQACTESVMLGVARGALGLLLARWAIALASTPLADLPRAADIRIDTSVLLFSAAVSLLTSLVFGLAPAWHASRVNLVDALKGTSRGAAAGTSRTGRALVVAEVALTLMLLLASALLLQSFRGLLHVPLGFSPEGVLTMRLSLAPGRFTSVDEMGTTFERLVARVEEVPGVSSAAAALNIPPNSGVMAPLHVPGRTPEAMGERPIAVWSGITPHYFATMRMPVLAGRTFTESDVANGQRVAIVSAALAKRIWGDEPPIGHSIQIGRLPGLSEIVGVVGDVKNVGIGSETLPQVYSPYVQRPWTLMNLVVRASAGDPRRLEGAVRRAIQEVDRDQAVTNVQTLDATLATSIAPTRTIAAMLGAFAAIAVLMAAAGLYGVLAYTVTQRRREIAVRLALGARPRAVFALIVRDGLRLTALGLVAGVVGAAFAARAMTTLLFGVSEFAPLTYAGVSVLLVTVALAACYPPARRAARIEPTIALRS